MRNGTHLLRRDAAEQSRDFAIGLNHRRKRVNKTLMEKLSTKD